MGTVSIFTVTEQSLSDNDMSGRRGRSNRARLHLAAAAAIVLALASCASTIRSRIYLPEPMPATISWSGRAPDEVVATSADGLRLRGYYWPPQAEGGDLILFFHGNGGNRYT